MKKYLIMIFCSIIIISCGGTADILEVGAVAPDFTLEDATGNNYTLSDYRDKSPVVIYFYPKANTSGCTTQACGIRDDYKIFEENNIVIFGISVDSKKDIQEFINEHQLNFPLLSDKTKEVSKNYGVLNNLGMSSRITFIVDKAGKLAHIIRDVDVDNHSKEVFELAVKL